MAGGSTVTVNKIRDGVREVWEIVCDWTADTTGTVQTNIASALYAGGLLSVPRLSGQLLSIEVIPGANGNRVSTSSPTIAANHTFLDDYGFDLSEAVFNSSSIAVASRKHCDPNVFLRGGVQLNVASVGTSGRQGRDILWVLREG